MAALPAPGFGALERVLVIGTTGAGKSTFAERLARLLDQPRVELDELYWDAGWQPKPVERFREIASSAVTGSRWIVDGNYGVVRDTLWPRATTVIWLNYGFVTVLRRLLWRTVTRALTRRQLWHGNQESFRKSFFSRDSILVWGFTTYHRRKRAFAELRRSNTYPHLAWVEFTKPVEAERYLRALTVQRARTVKT